MRIAQFIPYSGRPQGGPVISLASYVSGLCDVGCDVTLFSVAREIDGTQMNFDPRAEWVRESRSRGGSFRWSPDLWRRARAASFDLVHSYCLWTDVNRLAAAQARERRIPHVLAPCGHLQKFALKRSWWKKAPCRLLFQDRALREAACLHAKSEAEVEGIRAYGLTAPVAVIPNPIEEPPAVGGVSVEAFRAEHGISPGRKLALFLGRIHPVKGLDRIVNAWSGLASYHKDWLLVLAGPDEGGFRAQVEAWVRERGVESSVVFTGALNHEAKWAALSACEFLVIASDFENFCVSIGEALMASRPVVTTYTTPWKILPERGAGWWVETNPQALGAAMGEAMGLNDAARRAMGAKARVIAEPFRPRNVAASLMELYTWVLGKGSRPDCVIS